MLKLTSLQLREIFAHAQGTKPQECCGLIGGKDNAAQSIYKLKNDAPNALVAYEAAPEELFAAQRQMRERQEELLAIYHSHPRASDTFPSDTDIRQAFYPTAVYLIIGLKGGQPVMRAFRISEKAQSWDEVEYEISDE
jgi:proteasome lid subunit RPN8/RPN11